MFEHQWADSVNVTETLNPFMTIQLIAELLKIFFLYRKHSMGWITICNQARLAGLKKKISVARFLLNPWQGQENFLTKETLTVWHIFSAILQSTVARFFQLTSKS